LVDIHAPDAPPKKSFMDMLHDSEQNINVRAAMIHVIGDAVQSVGVMLAAAVIWIRPDWSIADPICTFLFSLIVISTTIRILKDGFLVLMEGVPSHIDQAAVLKDLRALPGVLRVHELHIWSLSMGNTALSVHILAEDSASDVLSKANTMLSDKYDISHTTIQIESLSDNVSCHQVTRRTCVREGEEFAFGGANSNPVSRSDSQKDMMTADSDLALTSTNGYSNSSLGDRYGGVRYSPEKKKMSSGHGHSHSHGAGEDDHGHSHSHGPGISVV